MFYLLGLIFCFVGCVISPNPNCPPNKFVRLCSYEEWAIWFDRNYKFLPKDLKPASGLCTHVLYAFAILDEETLQSIKPHNPKLAFEKGFYKQIVDLKKDCVTPILSIGGWEDSTPKWSEMLKDKSKRLAFVKQTTDFIIANGFLGADMGLSYPTAWQGKKDTGLETDKENFLKLLKELRKEFDSRKSKNQPRLHLSVQVTGKIDFAKKAYDIDAMKDTVDWITVLASHWKEQPDDKNNHHRANFEVGPSATEDDRQGTTVNILKSWIALGVPAQKLVLSLPFYGLLAEKDNPDLKYVSFNTIADMIESESGWKVEHTDFGSTYARNEAEGKFVVFDDTKDVAKKALFVKQQEFLGIMVWAVDKDRFYQNRCGIYPLMTAIKQILTEEITDIARVGYCTDTQTTSYEAE